MIRKINDGDFKAALAQLAARHRAEADGPPEGDVESEFFQLGAAKDWKAAGELEDIVETGEELEEFDLEEDDWRELGEGD